VKLDSEAVIIITICHEVSNTEYSEQKYTSNQTSFRKLSYDNR